MKKYVSNLALLVSLSATTLVYAAPNSFYIGGQLGYGNIYQSPANGLVTSVSGNGGGLAGRVYGGYQFTSYIATELGYSKFSNSSMTYKLANDGFGNPASGPATVTAYAIDFIVKGIVPLHNGFSLFGKLGIAGINENAGTVTLSSPIDGTSESVNINCNSIFPTYGVGTAYQINDNLATDFSWMRIQGTGNSNIQSSDLVMLGLVYYFI
jgi:OOP family OmpA-OmpF porin